MRILVTGSNGFIGRKLVSELLKKGHGIKNFTRSRGQNLLNNEQVEESLKGIDVVYHLAAIIDETDKTIFEVNVLGTKNLIEAAAKAKVKQFIFLSTCGVYGSNESEVDEKTVPTPGTGYEKSKWDAEKIVSNYLEVIPITIVRCPLVLGKSEVWKKILKMLQKGFPLTCSGKNFYQLVYIDDLVDALIFVLNNNQAIGETFVVCQDDRLTLMEVCIEIQKNAGINKKILTVPLWLGKIASYVLLIGSKIFGKKTIIIPQYVDRLARNRKYNIAKIKSIGWVPKFSTKEAIRLTVAELLLEKGKEKGKV